MSIKSKILLLKPQRGSHFLSHIVRIVAEHKAFRSSVSVLGVVVVLATAFTYQAPVVFSAADFTSASTVTADTTVQTKSGSHWPISGSLSTYFSSYHPGIDILQALYTPINPFYKGVVIQAGFRNDGYGNMILIDHQNGYVSRYAHLDKILVKVGDSVTESTVIGTVGLTGHTTGSHLHFEIYENGTPVDPLSILPQTDFSKIATAPITLTTQKEATVPANLSIVSGGPEIKEKEPMEKLTVRPSITELAPSGSIR